MIDSSYLNSALGDRLLSIIQDKETSEIYRNNDGRLWAYSLLGEKENLGRIISDDAADTIIRLVASQSHGGEVHQDSPKLSGTLPYYHARFEGLVAPIVNRPVFSIRKHLALDLTLSDYVQAGVLTTAQAEYLSTVIGARKNILIGGETFSGKSTLLNAMLGVASQTGDRFLIAEDNRELRCHAADKVEMLVNDRFTMRHAVMSMMRLNPDRIVIGELRDGTALDLLKAWTTHAGGLCTIHSTTAKNALIRLEMLVQEVVPEIPRMLIGDVIDVVVQISYTKGKRIVTQIAEVQGFNVEKQEYNLNYI